MSPSRQAAWRSRRSGGVSFGNRPRVQPASSAPRSGKRAERGRHAAHRVEERVLSPEALLQTREGQPLAQAECGENDLARRGGGQQALHHQRGERQQIQPPARHAANARQRTAALAGDQAGHPGDRAPAQPVMMDDAERIADLRHVRPRQRPPVAADGVERAPARFAEPGQSGQGRIDDPPRAPARAARGRGEVERPQGQRRLLGDLSIHQADQLQAAAAEVAHHAIRPRHAAQHAEGRHLRFFRTGEDAHAKTAAPLDLGDERAAVRRVAHRSGGDRVERPHLHRPQQNTEALEVRERQFDALRGEPAGIMQAAAEAAHDFFVEQGQRHAPHAVEHDQANRVRADVDDAIPLSGAPRPIRRIEAFSRLAQSATSPGRRPAAARSRGRTDSDSS